MVHVGQDCVSRTVGSTYHVAVLAIWRRLELGGIGVYLNGSSPVSSGEFGFFRIYRHIYSTSWLVCSYSPAYYAAGTGGTELTVSGIARAAAVDRTFLYRHRDLLEQVHALEAAPPSMSAAGPAVTRASLQADLLAHESAVRLNARVRQLEKRLSEALGEQAWHESGLGAPADIDALTARITQAEQEAADLRIQLADRDDELAAARAANRELMTSINYEPKTR